MVIAFCGHAQFPRLNEYEDKMLSLLEELVGDNRADFYLGGYGDFDHFAYACCKKYKETHPKVSLIFIAPYMTVEYQRNHLKFQKDRYDEIIYPDIENKPLKFAIVYRNQWMVENADCLVCGIMRSWGGAYKTYQYAKRKGKTVFNIVDNK